jgi:ferredoxin
MQIGNIFFFSLTTVALITLAWASVRENHKRAFLISCAFLCVNTGFWLLLIRYQDISPVYEFSVMLQIFLISIFLLSLVRYFPTNRPEPTAHVQRFDERDHMFSRNNLQHHRDLFERYYNAHPGKKETDVYIQSLPELLSPGGTYYDEVMAPLGIAFDSVTVSTSSAEALQKAKRVIKLEPEIITDIIKKAGKHCGAAEVGITRLRDYHLYSHKGRHAGDWGKSIQLDHTYAIVFLVPMETTMIKFAPTLPQILESTGKYVETAKIAHIIANYIKLLGYDAKAHYDGQYEVACVPLARDAGLGEVGRLGILMHSRYGPCLRLSAVTTTLELIETDGDYRFMESFCNFCRKCADNCPSRSIISGEKPVSRGFRHWSIDMEGCYTFWKKSGTDCGVCISSCPFTKPDTTIHKLARFYVSRNPVNQRIALLFDDVLYKRKSRLRSVNPDRSDMIMVDS